MEGTPAVFTARQYPPCIFLWRKDFESFSGTLDKGSRMMNEIRPSVKLLKDTLFIARRGLV
jgi:hypothetical protein